MSWAVIRQPRSGEGRNIFVMQKFFDVTTKARRMPVDFSEECHVPVPMPEPVPDLRRPVCDVCGQDDHVVVRGLAELGVD